MSFENKVRKLKEVIGAEGGFDEFMKPGGLFERLTEVQEGKKAPLMEPEDFSIKEIFEAVNTSQFPIITGTLLSKKILAGYNEYPGIADRLVTKFTSSLKLDTIPGGFLKGDLEDIPEGKPYPHSADMAEKYVTVAGSKRGEILDITMEMIKFDQTGIILMRAAKFGRRAAKDREKAVLFTVQDATVSGKNYYAWYPSGSRLALYYATDRTSAYVDGTVYANQITDALADYTDIDAADALFALMMDENGDPIDVGENMILLTSRTLKQTGRRIVGEEYLPNNSGTSVGYHQKNPYAGTTHLFSPWIDKVSSNDWYYGDFKEQFIEKVVFPLQVLTRKDEKNPDAWERDVVASYKVRRFSQVGAVDNRYVVKSTGGS